VGHVHSDLRPNLDQDGGMKKMQDDRNELFKTVEKEADDGGKLFTLRLGLDWAEPKKGPWSIFPSVQVYLKSVFHEHSYRGDHLLECLSSPCVSETDVNLWLDGLVREIERLRKLAKMYFDSARKWKAMTRKHPPKDPNQ